MVSEGSELSKIVFITIVRLGLGVWAAAVLSLYTILALLCALFGGVASFGFLVSEDIGKKGAYSYIISNMVLFNLFWILAIHDYDQTQPAGVLSNNWWMYLALFVNAVIDFHLTRRITHKWGGKYSDKALKKEYKALKQEKKMVTF